MTTMRRVRPAPQRRSLTELTEGLRVRWIIRPIKSQHIE